MVRYHQPERKEERIVSIRCGTCGIELEKDDYVVLNFIYTLTHVYCFNAAPESILSIGNYEDIIEQFPIINGENTLH